MPVSQHLCLVSVCWIKKKCFFTIEPMKPFENEILNGYNNFSMVNCLLLSAGILIWSAVMCCMYIQHRFFSSGCLLITGAS